MLGLVTLAAGYLLAGGFSIFVLAIALGITAAGTWGSYYKSDRIALAAARAVPANPVTYRRLHNLVEGLCIAAGLPKPELYVVHDPSPNAFATGRDPNHSAIAVTTGLLERMNRVELEAVLAHELAHIRSYDIRTQTIAVTAVGAISLISELVLRVAMFGGFGGRNNNDDRGGNNPLAIVFLLLGVLFLAFAPLIAQLLHFSLSRTREFAADAGAVSLTRYPPALISALSKLSHDQSVVSSSPRVMASMWIECPLRREDDSRSVKLNRMFDTHPPIQARITALKEM